MLLFNTVVEVKTNEASNVCTKDNQHAVVRSEGWRSEREGGRGGGEEEGWREGGRKRGKRGQEKPRGGEVAHGIHTATTVHWF